MKQILAFLLAAVMCMSMLTACGRNKVTNDNTTTPSTKEETIPDKVGNAVEEGVNDVVEGTENVIDDVTGNNKDNNNNNNNSNNNGTNGDRLRADATLEEIVMKLGEELGITMPTKLDEATLKDVFAINPEWVEEYYGEYSAANTSADHLLAFKVKEGHVDDVKKALEERRDAIVQGFEEGLMEQLEKARNATIVEKGNYLFFVIAGDVQNGADKEVNRAKEIIDSYFE